MTTTDARGDSGTQPTPHYCTQRLTDDGTVTGCPAWPQCLFPDGAVLIERPADAYRDALPRTAHGPAMALGVGLLGLAAVVVLLISAVWLVLA